MVRSICVLTFVHIYFLCEFVDGFGEGSYQLVRVTDTAISHPEISPRLIVTSFTSTLYIIYVKYYRFVSITTHPYN